MKNIMKFMIYFVMILGMASCRSIPIEKAKVNEIVYQSRLSGESYAIGFINSKGLFKYSIDMDKLFGLPVWSNSGERLFLLIDHGYVGYPASISIESGKLKKCGGGQYYGQIQGTGNKENPLEVILMDAGGLYLYDMDNCEELERFVYHWDNIGGKMMFHFSYSPIINEVIYGIAKDYNNARYFEIISLNINNGQSRVLDEGINPSWSSNGEKIAYFGTDGCLYIMNPDGSEPQKKVDKKFFDAWGTLPPSLTPIIQWSPDNKWLVYHRCEQLPFDDCNIYKFNVQENTEELVIKNGVYPDWNPTEADRFDPREYANHSSADYFAETWKASILRINEVSNNPPSCAIGWMRSFISGLD